MSLFDDASLVLIPDGAKDGTLYSVKPTDGTGDFTFTRGSNLAATRVDENGLIEKGRENLLLHSNQFDTTWATSSASVTSGQSGYDGSNNAWLLTATNTFNRVQQSIGVSGVKRFSVYAKANTNDYLLLGSFEGAHYYATFNLATGAVDSNNINAISPSIEDVGNGWYRCSATWVNTTTEVRIGTVDASGQVAWASTTSGSIYIQDAQLEVGLVATDYIETGATTAQAGILEDLPRIDYSGGASCPALLLEPQRSNLVTYSEYYATGQWANTDVNLTTNYGLSPEGKMNASLWEFPTTNTTARIQYVLGGITTGATYTQSYYIKSLSGDLTLRIGTSAAVIGEFEDITATSEWQRFDFTSVASGTTEYPRIQNITGTQGAQILVYGAQFELGSYPTSYIPTYGSSVTRSADSCFLQNANVHSSSAGTIFFEVGDYDTNTSASGFNKILVFDEVNTTSLDNIIYFEEYAGNNTILLRKGGSNLLQTTPTYQDLRNSKIAIKWSIAGAKVFINGVLNKTYTGDASLDIQYFGFDNPYNGEIISTIKMKQLAGFPTALTDSECIALTTL